MKDFLEDTGENFNFGVHLASVIFDILLMSKIQASSQGYASSVSDGGRGTSKGGDSLPVLATYFQYVLNHCWRNALRAYMNWRII